MFPRRASTLLFLTLSLSGIQLRAWPHRTSEPLSMRNDTYPVRLPDLQASTTAQLGTTRPPSVTELTHTRGGNQLETRLQGGYHGWQVDPAFHHSWRRFVTINLWYPIYRTGSIIGSANAIPSNPILHNLEYMYTRIRNATLSEWAKLPEQSIVRVVCGHLVFVILPPANRTVPWSAVEEIAHWLLIVLASGAEFLMMGFYPFRVLTAVTWLYVAIVAPGPPPATFLVLGENYRTDENGHVWRLDD